MGTRGMVSLIAAYLQLAYLEFIVTNLRRFISGTPSTHLAIPKTTPILMTTPIYDADNITEFFNALY
jgi:hypothetical protein